ncbi:MAG: hypothetical protein IPK72_21605 [Candidatus Eisenbacteria bacterium]|nr:hypothetical protein [Candidatus Eisenbacteria bacterium]
MNFFASVGVSVFEQSRCWKWKGMAAPEAERLQGLHYEAFVKETWSANAPEGRTESLYQFLESQRNGFLNPSGALGAITKNVFTHFDPGTWDEHRYRALPAEIATIYKLCKKDHIQHGDTITLLHGTDDRGKMAAAALSAMLNEIKTHRIPAAEPPMPATIADPIELNWNPLRQDDFSSAMNRALDAIGPRLSGGRLVLSGGYKAAGLCIAHWLARQPGMYSSTAIIVLHETSEDPIVIPDGVCIRPAPRPSGGSVPQANA